MSAFRHIGRRKQPTNWSASKRTVLSENLRLQKLNKSSSEGPSKSRTMQLKSHSVPNQRTKGMPTPPARLL